MQKVFCHILSKTLESALMEKESATVYLDWDPTEITGLYLRDRSKMTLCNDRDQTCFCVACKAWSTHRDHDSVSGYGDVWASHI